MCDKKCIKCNCNGSTSNQCHQAPCGVDISKLDAPMTKLLTCYGYEEEMVMEVNPDVVECVHQDTGCKKLQRNICGFAAAEERSTFCHRPTLDDADSNQELRRTQSLSSTIHQNAERNKHKICMMVEMFEDKKSTRHGKYSEESHHTKNRYFERSFDKHKHNGIRKYITYDSETVCTVSLKDSKYSTTDTSAAGSEIHMQVDVEIGDSGSSSKSTSSRTVKGRLSANDGNGEEFSFQALDDYTCKEKKKNIVVSEKNRHDMCNDSNHCSERTFDPHTNISKCNICACESVYERQIYNRKYSTGNKLKDSVSTCSLNPTQVDVEIEVGTFGSSTSDIIETIDVNRTVDVHRVLLGSDNSVEGSSLCMHIMQPRATCDSKSRQSVPAEKKHMGVPTACCMQYCEGTATLKEREDPIPFVENKDNHTHFQNDCREVGIKNILPYLITGNIIQGYEKRITVRTERICLGNCRECPTLSSQRSLKISLEENSDLSELIIEKQSLNYDDNQRGSDERKQLSGGNGFQSVLENWKKRESLPVSIFQKKYSASEERPKVTTKADQEDFEIIDSPYNDWDTRIKSVSDYRNKGIGEGLFSEDWDQLEPAADRQDGLPESVSNDLNTRESNFEEQEIRISDPSSNELVSKQSISDEHSSEISVMDSVDLDGDRSFQIDKKLQVDRTMTDNKKVDSSNDEQESGNNDLVLHECTSDKSIQFENLVRNTPNSIRGEQLLPGKGSLEDVDPIIDYLKRGIFLQSDAERQRHKLKRKIGKNILTEVGGIKAARIAHDDKSKDCQQITKTERDIDDAMHEVLCRVPSFRSTLDETTTLFTSHYPYHNGNTTTYLGDRISYLHTPWNGLEKDTSASPDLETSYPTHRRPNLMLDKVTAILNQIDRPYLSKVGKDIVQSNSKTRAENKEIIANNNCSLDVGEDGCGVRFKNDQPQMSGNEKLDTASDGKAKAPFLSSVFSFLHLLKPKKKLPQITTKKIVSEPLFSSPDQSDTDESISDDGFEEILPVNSSNKNIVTQDLTSSETVRRLSALKNESHHYRQNHTQSKEKDTRLHRADKHIDVQHDKEHSKSKPMIDVNKERDVASNKGKENLPSKKAANSDGKPIKKKLKLKNKSIVSPTPKVFKVQVKKRNSKDSVSEDNNEEEADIDSQSACSTVSDVESDVDEESANSAIQYFASLRGYPTRMYPVALYCLCIALVYLYWIACYFNCTYTLYGFHVESQAWYCRVYRYTTDANPHSSQGYIERSQDLLHPFIPWRK